MKLTITPATLMDYLLTKTVVTLRADDEEAKQFLAQLVESQRHAKRQARRERKAKRLKREWS